MGAKVPQNITREDHIVGPLTLKQFLFFLLGGSLLFLIYQGYSIGFLYPAEVVIYGTFVLALVVAFSFVKINGRPFETFLLNLWGFIRTSKSRTWGKEPEDLLPKIMVKDLNLKNPRTEMAEKQSGKDIKGELTKLTAVLDTGGTMDTDEAGGQDRIGSLTDTKPRLADADLGVEDILED